MKTNSRKRLLVSSVAMLLVAMLALGTATYAWFTTNPNANASGLQMKATASKGLMIQTESHAKVTSSFWGHDDYLNYVATGGGQSSTTSVALNPVSFDLSVASTLGQAYKVDAKADTAYAADNDAAVSNASGGIATGDYYQEKIKCKVTGGAETANLKMTSLDVDANTDLAMISAMRIAISYYDKSADTNTLIGVYSASGTASNKYLKAPENYSSGTTKFNDFTLLPAGENNQSFNVATANTAIGTVDKTGNDYITVTIYLDGENSNCYTSIIDAADLINSIKVNLTVNE